MQLTPVVQATAAKPVCDLWYHEVAHPSTESVQAAFGHAAEFEQRTGAVDVTPFVDICLRFASLAYRRNAGRTSCQTFGDMAELQFAGASGAHAVLYLFPSANGRQLLGVLSFKGSTANLEDWIHNLEALRVRPNGSGGPDLVNGVPLIEGDAARVHPGAHVNAPSPQDGGSGEAAAAK
jgi:hypothetical protein